MTPRPFLIAALLLAPAASAHARADDAPRADPDAGKALLAEGDALADKGETTEAVLRYKQAFEQLLPGLRHIPFAHEVNRDVTAREDLRQLLLKEIDEELSPEEFRGQELAMKALGLIPKDLDYKEIMVKVYAEEIAAFYDPKTKTMHLIREPEAKDKKKPTFFERLLGKKGGFDKDENKTVIAHELTHALADQNYDLEAMHKAAKGDEDRELALAALIEGEATMAMIGAQMEDWDGDEIVKLPSEGLDRTFSLMGPLLGLGGGPALKEAPPILTESLLFPYLRGMVFCTRLANDGGWSAVDAAYKAPPLSTEQILHPEKYAKDPDAPTAIDLGDLEPPDGWKEVARNTLGEMQLLVLLKGYDAKRAAAGWDGDQYAAFAGPDNRIGLVWLTTWDSEDDARQFARSYLKFQTTKLGDDAPQPEDDAPDSVRRPHEGAAFAVERRGADVVVVEGFPPEAADRLLDRAFAATKAEKTRGPARPAGE